MELSVVISRPANESSVYGVTLQGGTFTDSGRQTHAARASINLQEQTRALCSTGSGLVNRTLRPSGQSVALSLPTVSHPVDPSSQAITSILIAVARY